MSELSLRTPRARGADSAAVAASVRSRGNGKAAQRCEGVFAGYRDVGSYAAAFDEMFEPQGNVRAPYKGIYAELAPSDASELEARADALKGIYSGEGSTDLGVVVEITRLV